MQWLKFVPSSLVLYLAVMSQEVWGTGECPAPTPCICTGNDVDCASKNLTEVPDFVPTNRDYSLLKLSLQNNEIETLGRFNFTMLKATGAEDIVLNLAGNKIYNVSAEAFVGIEYKITELYMQNNNISKIPPLLKNLENLKILDLSDNHIGFIAGKALRHLEDLVVFKLSGNPVWFIDLSSFYGLNQVTSLYLDKTRLKYIPHAITRLESLTYLSLEDASVKCTCELYQDKHWLEGRTVEIVGNCTAPAKFVDMPIAQYIEKKFSKCPW